MTVSHAFALGAVYSVSAALTFWGRATPAGRPSAKLSRSSCASDAAGNSDGFPRFLLLPHSCRRHVATPAESSGAYSPSPSGDSFRSHPRVRLDRLNRPPALLLGDPPAKWYRSRLAPERFRWHSRVRAHCPASHI